MATGIKFGFSFQGSKAYLNYGYKKLQTEICFHKCNIIPKLDTHKNSHHSLLIFKLKPTLIIG